MFCKNSRNAQPTCCRVAVSENFTIPSETEMLVEGFTTNVIDRHSTGLIEVDTKFLHKKGLLVAKALVCPSNGTVPIRIANPYNQSCTLNKHTIVATYEPLEAEELLTVNATQSSDSDQISCSTGEVPDHLKNLYSESCQNLNPEQQAKLKQLLIDSQNTFSRSSHDLGRTSLVEYKIDLMPGTRPIKQAPYRLPLAKRQEAENEIKLMAEKELIEPSTSPWSSPVIIIPKKTGGIRFCIDYRKLNKVTIQDSQALPRIDDSLDALGGAKWFSTLDLKSGFHQIGIREEDKPKTAFCIPGGGLWQFKVMPFGATTSPAVFERLMERVFAGLTYVTLLIYLDDIIIYGKTFEIHLENLKEVLRRLKEANLKLNAEKCLFFQTEVTFLGHLISEKGISTSPEKVKSVQEWPTPTNVSEVRSFVGLCSYLRRFIPGFSTICKPLHVLTEKGHNFEWTEQCQVAFNTLKAALTSAPVLAFPQELGGEFIVDCDSSNVALGAVLSQIQDGQERVIAYYSKCFSRSERKYCTTRKELLAVVCSIEHFHHYLYGRHFTVRSDHGSLRWLMNFKNIEGQVARWLEFLASYEFDIHYRPGISHQNADSMSRRPCIDNNCKYCDRIEEKWGFKGTGLINRNKGESVESIILGESSEEDGLIRKLCTDMGELASSEIEMGKSICPLEVHLQGQSSENYIPACNTTGGIRMNTSLPKVSHNNSLDTQEKALENSGSSSRTVDRPHDQATTQLDRYCSSKTVDRPENQYQNKPLQLRDIPEIRHEAPASAGNLVIENSDPYTEKSGIDFYNENDSENFITLCTGQPDIGDFDETSEKQSVVSQFGPMMDDYSTGESETMAIRLNETVDIDCMSPENISREQENDNIVSLIREWKMAGKKPSWKYVAPYGAELKTYGGQWESLVLLNNIVHRKCENYNKSGQVINQIVLPTSLRKTAFVLLHETVTAGHLGPQKTFGKVRQRFYWFHYKEDIEHWCKVCDICASRKQPYRKAKAPMRQYNVGYPLERVAIDIMGPLPCTHINKARYLLLVSCYFTKWLDAIPLVTIDAKTIAIKLIERFISVFGVPTLLHSDQGSNFESTVFKEVCNLLGIQKTRTTPGRPQSDGMVERACRSVQAMLSAFVAQNQKDWDQFVPLLMMAYRSSIHDTTKCTPCAMMLGREIRLPIDLALGIPETRISTCESEYAYQLENQLVRIHDFARCHMQISSKGMKNYYDKRTNFVELSVGDCVWFHNPVRKQGISLKLQRPWKGPFVITQKLNDVLYKIQESPRGKSKVVHYDRLKRYEGENKPTWFNQ